MFENPFRYGTNLWIIFDYLKRKKGTPAPLKDIAAAVYQPSNSSVVPLRVLRRRTSSALRTIRKVMQGRGGYLFFTNGEGYWLYHPVDPLCK